MEERKPYYDWVLKDAEGRRSELARKIAGLQRELRELDSTIVGIWKLSGQIPATVSTNSTTASAATASGGAMPNPRAVSADPLKYATVSVRWAILLLLSEAAEPLGVPDIKTALEAGGIRSRAEDFKNNVSSVLSVMKSARQEVDVVDGKWQITETGRSAIDYIKATKLKKIYPRRATADASTSAVLQPKGGDGL